MVLPDLNCTPPDEEDVGVDEEMEEDVGGGEQEDEQDAGGINTEQP